MSNVFKIGDGGKKYDAVMVKPLAEVNGSENHSGPLM
jgi:hypothetical protein